MVVAVVVVTVVVYNTNSNNEYYLTPNLLIISQVMELSVSSSNISQSIIGLGWVCMYVCMYVGR